MARAGVAPGVLSASARTGSGSVRRVRGRLREGGEGADSGRQAGRRAERGRKKEPGAGATEAAAGTER